MTCIKSKHREIWNVHFQLLYIIEGTIFFRLWDTPQTFQCNFSKLTNWKLSQNTRLYGAATIFGDLHLNYNNTLSNEADYSHLPVWTKAKKVTYFDQKQKNYTYQTKKHFFSKAANNKGICFCSINKSAGLAAAYWLRYMHR